jgi:hypothetical protein
MDALLLALRAELRRRWRPMLGLALLLGLIGGVVLTAAAGARNGQQPRDPGRWPPGPARCPGCGGGHPPGRGRAWQGGC